MQITSSSWNKNINYQYLLRHKRKLLVPTEKVKGKKRGKKAGYQFLKTPHKLPVPVEKNRLPGLVGQKHISSHMGYPPPPPPICKTSPVCQCVRIYHHGQYGWTLTLTYILTMNHYNNNSDNISENLECLIFSKALSTYVITTHNPTKSKHKKVQTNAFLFWQIQRTLFYFDKDTQDAHFGGIPFVKLQNDT